MSKKNYQPNADESQLLAKEASIRANAEALLESDRLVWFERAKRAADWVVVHRPELTFGTAPDVLRIADDDVVSLAEFEDYGRNGNAVLIHEADFGEIWWCDPEGKKFSTSRFAFTKGSGCAVAYEIRFHQARQDSN